MDRTSWIVVIACVIVLIGWENYVIHKYPPKPRHKTTQTTPSASTSATQSVTPLPAIPSIPAPNLASVSTVAPSEVRKAQLENKVIRVYFSSLGGAIEKVELKEHRGHDKTSNLILNEYSAEGILNLSGWDGENRVSPWALESSTPEKVSFARTLLTGAVVRRVYRLSEVEEYSLTMDQTITNPGPQELKLPEYRLNLGQSNSIHPRDQAIYLTAGWLASESDSFHKVSVDQFNAGNILGFHTHDARSIISSEPEHTIAWAAVKNQFFTTLLTAPAGKPASRVDTFRDPATESHLGTLTAPWMMRAEAVFPAQTLAAGASETQTFGLYTGPKEYSRLKKLGAHQDLVMDFGMFKPLVIPILSVMKWFHSFIPNYGIVVIVLTILLKLMFWPMQTMANKNMKYMQALQPKMKELQDKHKDAPEKLNTEMLKLYKDYGVNPAAGCLPMLVQIPVFIGFYQMLQSAVEMRNQAFLWIPDLAQPDTITHLMGIPLNPLPLIMTATSMLMMRMTPQTSDNPQMKMMQYMPLMMLFMLYNFASALALYWTVNNLFSMLQTWKNLQTPVPTLKRVPKKKTT